MLVSRKPIWGYTIKSDRSWIGHSIHHKRNNFDYGFYNHGQYEINPKLPKDKFHGRLINEDIDHSITNLEYYRTNHNEKSLSNNEKIMQKPQVTIDPIEFSMETESKGTLREDLDKTVIDNPNKVKISGKGLIKHRDPIYNLKRKAKKLRKKNKQDKMLEIAIDSLRKRIKPMG